LICPQDVTVGLEITPVNSKDCMALAHIIIIKT